jgi:hypothetical protein
MVEKKTPQVFAGNGAPKNLKYNSIVSKVLIGCHVKYP